MARKQTLDNKIWTMRQQAGLTQENVAPGKDSSTKKAFSEA